MIGFANLGTDSRSFGNCFEIQTHLSNQKVKLKDGIQTDKAEEEEPRGGEGVGEGGWGRLLLWDMAQEQEARLQ